MMIIQIKNNLDTCPTIFLLDVSGVYFTLGLLKMWLIFFALSLAVLIPIAVTVQLNISTLAVSILFCIVFIVAIYKDSQTPKTSYGWLFIIIFLGMRLSSMVKNQSSFMFGVIYIFALALAAYSAWQLYISSDSKNEAS